MTDFEMTREQLEALIKEMQPVPMIALQCGSPSSRQENANRAWEKLGRDMGFNHMTVKPNGRGDRFFSAEASPL